MHRLRYIQTLLPLRLKWEPFYSYSEEQLPGSLAVGDRVRVEFGGKEYVAVVTAVDAEDEAGAVGYDRIKPISPAPYGDRKQGMINPASPR